MLVLKYLTDFLEDLIKLKEKLPFKIEVDNIENSNEELFIILEDLNNLKENTSILNVPLTKDSFLISVKHTLLLEVVINDETFTIERKLFSPNLEIIIHFTEISNLSQNHQKIEISPKQSKSRESISSFVLKKLNLWDIPLKESPTKEETGIDIMSIRDLLWFCYLDQGRIRDDRDFLFEKTYMKNIKFKQVFKVTFDIYYDIEAILKSQFKTYKDLLKDKTKALNSLKKFLDESKIPEKEELIKKKKELEKGLYIQKKNMKK